MELSVFIAHPLIGVRYFYVFFVILANGLASDYEFSKQVTGRIIVLEAVVCTDLPKAEIAEGGILSVVQLKGREKLLLPNKSFELLTQKLEKTA